MPKIEINWPDWWRWSLDCDNPHLLKRMRDRGFDEVALREMLEAATGWRPDHVSGRFVIECRYNARRWGVGRRTRRTDSNGDRRHGLSG